MHFSFSWTNFFWMIDTVKDIYIFYTCDITTDPPSWNLDTSEIRGMIKKFSAPCTSGYKGMKILPLLFKKISLQGNAHSPSLLELSYPFKIDGPFLVPQVLAYCFYDCRELILALPSTLRQNNVQCLQRHICLYVTCYEKKGDLITTSERHNASFLFPLSTFMIMMLSLLPRRWDFSFGNR